MRRRLTIAAVVVAAPAIIVAGWLAGGIWDAAQAASAERARREVS